jgi:hypothetical protein
MNQTNIENFNKFHMLIKVIISKLKHITFLKFVNSLNR